MTCNVNLKKATGESAGNQPSGDTVRIAWSDALRASVQAITPELDEFERNRDRLAASGFPFGHKEDLSRLRPRS